MLVNEAHGTLFVQVYAAEFDGNYRKDLSITHMSILSLSPSSQFFWGKFLRTHSDKISRRYFPLENPLEEDL